MAEPQSTKQIVMGSSHVTSEKLLFFVRLVLPFYFANLVKLMHNTLSFLLKKIQCNLHS